MCMCKFSNSLYFVKNPDMPASNIRWYTNHSVFLRSSIRSPTIRFNTKNKITLQVLRRIENHTVPFLKHVYGSDQTLKSWWILRLFFILTKKTDVFLWFWHEIRKNVLENKSGCFFNLKIYFFKNFNRLRFLKNQCTQRLKIF